MHSLELRPFDGAQGERMPVAANAELPTSANNWTKH